MFFLSDDCQIKKRSSSLNSKVITNCLSNVTDEMVQYIIVNNMALTVNRMCLCSCVCMCVCLCMYAFILTMRVHQLSFCKCRRKTGEFLSRIKPELEIISPKIARVTSQNPKGPVASHCFISHSPLLLPYGRGWLHWFRGPRSWSIHGVTFQEIGRSKSGCSLSLS